MPDASEVAFVLAELVSDRTAFPDDAASDLRRVLGHRIATPTPAVLRYDRLQLLLSMLLDDGVVPTVDEYTARRIACRSDAPASSTLINAYGHWLGACRAAWRFVDRTGHPSVPHTLRYAGPHEAYTLREILDAIIRFRTRFGDWPTQWEFIEWGQIERRAAGRTGAPGPRIPAAGSLARAFGTFPRALAAAQRSEGDIRDLRGRRDP